MNKLTKIQKIRTMKQLTAAGFTPWQVGQFPKWAEGLANRRQWRRAARKVYGISVKA